MSLLKNLEKKLENIIEGAFSKGFPSQVQPVEIAKKIDLELRENKTVSLSRTFAPNHFDIKLSERDYGYLEGFIDAIKKELSDYVTERAKESNLFITEVEINFKKDKKVRYGQFQVKSTLTKEIKEEVQKEVKSQATKIIPKEEILKSLEVIEHIIEQPDKKKVFKLIKPVTIIGRSKVSDISLNDPSISRKHVELVKENDRIRLVDLGSTNGTMVNDTRVKAKMLRAGDKILIGKSALIYRRRNG